MVNGTINHSKSHAVFQKELTILKLAKILQLAAIIVVALRAIASVCV